MKELCGQCKYYENLEEYGFAQCLLGRGNDEFQEDGGITSCQYWEPKKIYKRGL